MRAMLSILFLTSVLIGIGCATSYPPKTEAQGSPQPLYRLQNPREIGQSSLGPIQMGGLSGLSFIEKDQQGAFVFWGITDRGPNGEAIKGQGKSSKRPFLLPSFQPRILKLRAKDGRLDVLEEIPLQMPNSIPMTGLPPGAGKSEFGYEIAVSNNKEIAPSKIGIDSESIAIDSQGRFWIGDEYGPSFFVFNKRGELVTKISPDAKSEHRLPTEYAQRKVNRGFEALGYHSGLIFAMTQSPLELSCTKSKGLVRILVIDAETYQVRKEFLTRLNETSADKIGDLAVINSERLLIIEQNSHSGPKGVHRVVRLDLSNATNLRARGSEIPKPECLDEATLAQQVRLADRAQILDLVSLGYDFADKIEGLTIVDQNQIAVINDNDFKIDGAGLDSSRETVLGIFRTNAPLW